MQCNHSICTLQASTPMHSTAHSDHPHALQTALREVAKFCGQSLLLRSEGFKNVVEIFGNSPRCAEKCSANLVQLCPARSLLFPGGEVHHVFSRAQIWCGAKKMYVEKVYVLFLSLDFSEPFVEGFPELMGTHTRDFHLPNLSESFFQNCQNWETKFYPALVLALSVLGGMVLSLRMPNPSPVPPSPKRLPN